MKIEVQCDQCGSTFPRHRKQVNQKLKAGYKTYCSKECQKIAKTTSITFNCDKCGKEATLGNKEYQRSKSGKHYCSQSCAISENNKGTRRNYKHGISLYRELALNHYERKCTICGYDIEQILEVHHRDSDRTNNEVENLDVLCPTHHNEYQFGVRKY